jgi:glucosamine--fructose-6-phosphate aminotransferase (isomerizing)
MCGIVGAAARRNIVPVLVEGLRRLYVIADRRCDLGRDADSHVVRLPGSYGVLSPLYHVVPLQLLAYHTALMRGTDVDKPRNLAKSVTLE